MEVEIRDIIHERNSDESQTRLKFNFPSHSLNMFFKLQITVLQQLTFRTITRLGGI